MIRCEKIIDKFNNLKNHNNKLIEQIKTNQSSLALLEESLSLLYQFNDWLNSMIKEKIETIANAALQNIFPDKQMSFMLESRPTKRGVYYDLYIKTNGVITELYEAKGGGVLDVINMCLRITYVNKLKGRIRQTIVLDEPFKNLDAERVTYASNWLKKVSETFNIQFIIITHIPSLILTVDDGAFEIQYNNGCSKLLQ